MIAATQPHPVAHIKAPRILPIVVATASGKTPSNQPKHLHMILTCPPPVSLVASYVYSQLRYETHVMDSRFAQYNNAQSEASRRKTFEGTNSDPRTSMFNILGH